eukprot:GAHX01002153.1.p1 GENE.GAHX01002153.1~~GAHX01002153.1.p1  ORF type:complete len:336 (-),score=61.52 GAHX01002153.1:33-1040(-)
MKTNLKKKVMEGLDTETKTKIQKTLTAPSSRCLLVVSPFYEKAHIDLLNYTSERLSQKYPNEFSISYQNIKLNSSVKHITQGIINDSSIFSNDKKGKKLPAKVHNLSYTVQIRTLENELSKFKKSLVILDNFEEFISGNNSKFLYSYLSLLESKNVNLFTIFIARKVFGTEKIEKRCRSRLSFDKVFIGDANKANLSKPQNSKGKLNSEFKTNTLDESVNYLYLSQLEKIVLVFLLIEIKQKETPNVFDIHVNIIESYKNTHSTKTMRNFPYKLIEKMIMNMEQKGIVCKKHKQCMGWDREDEVQILGLKSSYSTLLKDDIESLPIWVHNFIKLV